MRNLPTMGCAVAAIGILLGGANPAQAIKILMHGREPAATFRDDPFTFQHLETVFGADNVDYMQGSAAPADGSAVNGYDVLYISSSMASSDTRDKYEDSAVGIVCSENALIHDNNVGNFMLSDAGGNQDMITDRQKITIVDPTHPLAAGLSGEVTVFNSAENNWWQFGRSPLAAGVDLVANMVLPESDPPPDPQHAIFAADVGAQLLGDGTPGSPMTAAGRRVFFFLSDFGSFDLTTEGFMLFDAAIQWAAATPATGDFDNDQDVDGADFLAWQKGLAASSPQRSDGDSNGDGDVDADDLAAWAAQFGAAGVAAVPEPASAVSLLVAAICCRAARRKLR
jgi:hypothetical protein